MKQDLAIRPQTKSLQLSSASISRLPDSSGFSVSVYQGELSTRGIVEGIKKIKLAFPDLPLGFYDILSDRLKANKFSDRRLQDSIDNVIDGCQYPHPTIAQFISWDKKIKMFTYEQILKLNDENPGCMKNYQSFQFKDKATRVWIHLNDVKEYNITE